MTAVRLLAARLTSPNTKKPPATQAPIKRRFFYASVKVYLLQKVSDMTESEVRISRYLTQLSPDDNHISLKKTSN